MKRTGPILEVKNISRDFGTVRALNNVSFVLEEGKILGIVGDNGAGRTTLLNILSGAFQPSSGSIYFKGKEVRFRSPADAMRMRISTVHQSFELVEMASIWENFFMGREITRRIGPLVYLDIKKMKDITQETVTKYGHKFDIDREIGELSGGQRQIITVTRAIEAGPEILLLDEPIHGLSVRVINNIFDILRKAKEEKDTSIIITSQWYEQISDFIDDVIVLRRGEIAGQFDEKSADKARIFKLAMGLATR
jgi:simple sugar transport system ATP-binding protein